MMYNIGANCEKYCLILYENETKKENFCNRRSSFADFGNCFGDFSVNEKRPAASISPFADYMIASQDLQHAGGLDYKVIAENLGYLRKRALHKHCRYEIHHSRQTAR